MFILRYFDVSGLLEVVYELFRPQVAQALFMNHTKNRLNQVKSVK